MANLKKLKKGDTVILHMFTGIAVGVKDIVAADKTTVTLETRAGTAKFSRETGKQIEPQAKAERFANYITENDGSYVPVKRKPKGKKEKTADAPAEPKSKAADFDEDDFDEAEYEED